jgi:hypothetical protein
MSYKCPICQSILQLHHSDAQKQIYYCNKEIVSKLREHSIPESWFEFRPKTGMSYAEVAYFYDDRIISLTSFFEMDYTAVWLERRDASGYSKIYDMPLQQFDNLTSTLISPKRIKTIITFS